MADVASNQVFKVKERRSIAFYRKVNRATPVMLVLKTAHNGAATIEQMLGVEGGNQLIALLPKPNPFVFL